MAQLSHKIDWLTLTYKHRVASSDPITTRSQLIQFMCWQVGHIGVDASEYEEVRGDGFYDVHLWFPKSEVRVSGSFSLETQGIRAVFSGKALPTALYGLRVLQSAIENDWKPTRIDIALDTFNFGVTVEDWYNEVYEANSGNKQRSIDFKHSRSGDTLTIGSRHSEKYMRIYDKAAQQGLDNDWVRLEVETKGSIAIQLAAKILHEWQSAPMLHILMLNLPNFWLAQEIEAYAHGEVMKFERVMPTKDGHDKWLDYVVGKALARLKAKDKAKFDELMTYVDELSQGYEEEL